MRSESIIRSRSNPLIRRVDAAAQGKAPGKVLLEGERLIEDGLRAGCDVEVLLVAGGSGHVDSELARRLGSDRVRSVEPALLQRVSRLRHSPGVLALGSAPPERSLDSLEIGATALLLVVAGVADPGNLGALARSAEAAGATALVVTRGGVSPWNEKALRGSMGSLLRLPVVNSADVEEVAGFLEARGVRQVVAATRGGTAPGECDWSGPVAIWIGAETGAVPAAFLTFEKVTVPMAGAVESLNVTVAASLLLFASGRGGEGRS